MSVDFTPYYYPYIYEKYGDTSNEVEQIIKCEFDLSNNIPKLVFGKYTQVSKDFIKNVEDLKNSLTRFDNYFFKVLTNNRIINYSLFEYIPNIEKLINKIKPNLKVEFSNKAPAPKTKEIIEGKLTQYLENLYPLLRDLQRLLETKLKLFWKSLDQNNQIGNLFTFNYDIFDITEIKSFCKNYPNFTSLSDIKSLASPIFYLTTDNQIICSVETLKCQIGPIFPSLASNQPISINLISFIESDILLSIDQLNDPQYYSLLSTKEKLGANEPIQLFVKTSELTANKDEIIKLSGKLKIETKGIQPFLFPFEISVAIIPLEMRLRCLQYPLSEIKKNYFRLCCSKVDSRQIIDIELINYFVHNQFSFAVELESLEENRAQSPSKFINKAKKCISLTMPQVNEPTRCQFDIIIKLSKHFETRILCDFIITPVDFVFEMYDYCKKEFTSNNCQLIVKYGLIQKIYFRVLFPSIIREKGYITTNLPKDISIRKQSIDKEFDINGDFYFNFDILTYNTPSDNKNIGITLRIGNIQKTIKITFIDPMIMPFIVDAVSEKNTYYLTKFPCYSYLHKDKKWQKIKNDEEIHINMNTDVPYIIVSPFNYYSNIIFYTVIKYNINNYGLISVADAPNTHTVFLHADLNIYSEKNINISNSPEKVKAKYNNYYTIIGYIKEDSNIWFPAFNEYPHISNATMLPYTDNDSTVHKALTYKDQMYNCLNCNHQQILYYWNYEDDIIWQTNSAILLTILYNKSTILHIDCIIEKFPPSLQSKFSDILQEIKTFISHVEELSDGLALIISNNLINRFVQVFQERYFEIKSHLFCLQMPINEVEIQNNITKAYQELMQFDTKNALTRNNNIKAYFNRREKELLDLSIESLPEESNQHNCFLISENDNPKPCEPDKLGNLSFNECYEEESVVSNKLDAITSLPSIQPPVEKSIANYNLFYLSCAQGASVLPTVILNRKINELGQKEPEQYFQNLLNIYTEITKESVSNKSILSSSINRFIESFKNCVKRLRRAGANFSGMNLHQSLTGSSNYTQDFIWIPENESPYLSYIPWKTKDQIKNKSRIINEDSYFGGSNMHVEENKNDSKFNILPNPNPISDNKKDASISTNTHKAITQISTKQKKLLIQKVAVDIPDDVEKDDFIINDDNDDSTKNDTKPFFHIESTNSNSIDVKSEYFESIYNQINEIDILKFIVNRISKTDPSSELEFSDSWNSKNYDIQNQEQLFEIEHNNFPVSNLIDKSQYLITKLIASVSDSNCPLTSISCNLLIDCSNIISNEYKMFNFMLLASFSYALSALEIPFTISVIADQNFRFVMKPYEENISVKVLQRVLDCLFIKRYRANIADTFNHVIKVMKNPSRTQRAIFIFTDGLDENLLLTKSWKDLILNDPNYSFGLIFSKSKLLDDPKYDIIENMWKTFEKETKTAKSKTRLVYTNISINQATINKITRAFVDVLSLQNEINKQAQLDLKPIFSTNCEELTEDEFRKIERIMKNSFDNFKSPIFRKINQMSFISGTRFEKLDVNYYRNKTGKIASSLVNKSVRDNFDHFILQNMFSNKNSFRTHLESIFKPNKASQTVLSSTGTDFDITALIMNLINPVPDPLIYLEEKGGLTRNYGVSIIIDSSVSCFNQFSSFHSYQTIKVLFSALEMIEIPCVDVILATNEAPKILCSEIPSKRLFNRKSTFWPSFFSALAMNLSSPCNLESAIHAAYDLRRMRSVDSTSYMFVLTDGLYEKDQKELIKKHIASCAQNGIATFGIGIGIYPIGIDELFPNVIFSPNPNHLINGIASFFENEAGESYDNTIKVIMPEKIDDRQITHVFQQLIENENNPIFKDLKNHLSDTFVGMDAFSHVYNKEKKKLKNSMNQLINQEGEMYEENLFKGQKILIVMPYDANMNMKENQKLLPENLKESNIPGQCCVKQAVEYYGIDIEVVQNYKDAVKELTKKSSSGRCEYYAIWILSGLPYNVPLADLGNQHLVYQFIQCVLQFWEKGGAVVLFAEGDPLTFQANLFLKMITFPGEQSKTKLQLSNVHKGKKILIADETGELKNKGTFNKSPNEYEKFQRAPLGHNIFQIYEGETISYAPDDESIYSPFVPFMRDSEGGISALFYPGDRDQANKRGDIIIDCGYSKLFDAMTTEGTFKYVQNIASWTAQYESRYLSMPNAENFCPEPIIFKLKESVVYDGFLEIPKMLNTVQLKLNHRLFAIDSSGSVHNNGFYYNEVQKIINDNFKKGDHIITWSSSYNIITKAELSQNIAKKYGSGRTHPMNIIQACMKDISITRDHLILITDGQVSSQSIKKSDDLIKKSKLHFKYVTTYIIGSKGDLSVGAPFARDCGSKTIHITQSSRKEIIGANEHDFVSIKEDIDRINNINQFNANFDAFFNATKQKMIGTAGDPDLKIKFEQMNTRITRSGNVTADYNRKIKALIRMASGAILNVFDSEAITAMNF